jgi:hypothetical protein
MLSDRGLSRLIRDSSLIAPKAGGMKLWFARLFFLLMPRLSCWSSYWIGDQGISWHGQPLALHHLVTRLYGSCYGSVRFLLKFEFFAWKALSAGLATEMNKMRRHISVSSVCQICGHKREDVFHILLKCPMRQLSGRWWERSGISPSGCRDKNLQKSWNAGSLGARSLKRATGSEVEVCVARN